jgi:hypothetical protein
MNLCTSLVALLDKTEVHGENVLQKCDVSIIYPDDWGNNSGRNVGNEIPHHDVTVIVIVISWASNLLRVTD